MKNKYSIGILIFVILVLTGYASWYSFERHEKIVHNDQCANTDMPCIYEIVPPTLLDRVSGKQPPPLVSSSGCDQSATTTDCSPETTAPKVDPALLARLQTDMQDITPHFLDRSDGGAQPLNPAEQKIRDDVVAFFVTDGPSGEDFYSNLWLDAIGTRYILVTQPIAESSYDEILDSQTGMVTPIPESARYNLVPLDRNAVLYIDTQHIYLYTLDQATTILVPGSLLSGAETYTSGEVDNPSIIPRMSYTSSSITITIFDSNKPVPNPKLGVGAMMNGAVREITLSF